MAGEWWMWCSQQQQKHTEFGSDCYICTNLFDVHRVHLNSFMTCIFHSMSIERLNSILAIIKWILSSWLLVLLNCFARFFLFLFHEPRFFLKLWINCLFVCFIYKSHVLDDGFGQIIHNLFLSLFIIIYAYDSCIAYFNVCNCPFTRSFSLRFSIRSSNFVLAATQLNSVCCVE